MGRIAATLSALAGAWLAAPALCAELTLYADDDYQGRALSVVIDERQLGVLNFAGRASSVVVESSAWILCSGEDYSGQCVTLEPGRYPSLRALGLDDAVTSVRRREPASIGVFNAAPASAPRREAADIVLFANSDFGGLSHRVDRPRTDLRVESLQSQATSAVIANGQWELCEDVEFRGRCVTLGPGKYPSLDRLGLQYGAASVRRARPSPGPAQREN